MRSVMTGYNRLNGTYCSEHPWLLTDVLRGEWGFDGVVVSDWFGTHSAVESLRAGLDLEMPGPPRERGPALLRGGRATATSRERDLDAAVARLLALAEWTGAGTHGHRRGRPPTTPRPAPSSGSAATQGDGAAEERGRRCCRWRRRPGASR